MSRFSACLVIVAFWCFFIRVMRFYFWCLLDISLRRASEICRLGSFKDQIVVLILLLSLVISFFFQICFVFFIVQLLLLVHIETFKQPDVQVTQRGHTLSVVHHGRHGFETEGHSTD